MNATQRELILQRWNVIQLELLPELKNEVGPLTPKLGRVMSPNELPPPIEGARFTGKAGLRVKPAEVLTLIAISSSFLVFGSIQEMLSVFLLGVLVLAAHVATNRCSHVLIFQDGIHYVRGRVNEFIDIREISEVRAVGNRFVGRVIEIRGVVTVEINGNKSNRSRIAVQDVFSEGIEDLVVLIEAYRRSGGVGR